MYQLVWMLLVRLILNHLRGIKLLKKHLTQVKLKLLKITSQILQFSNISINYPDGQFSPHLTRFELNSYIHAYN